MEIEIVSDHFVSIIVMNSCDDYLPAIQLAALIGCKPNQFSMMTRWLLMQRWVYVMGRDGMPRVARAYHDKKMGIVDARQVKLDASPNLDAFRKVGENRC